jgi:3-oxoacyl-[acyl-carrier-protein] synthase II
MVAGGAESCIHPLAISGFARARSLATDWNDRPTEASRPFDKDRAGFVIGEGAGVVVLEVREPSLVRKNLLIKLGTRTCKETRREHIR